MGIASPEEVRKTKSGKIIWSSKGARVRGIKRELRNQGFDVRLDDEQITFKFYAARDTGNAKYIERAFRTRNQLDSFMRQQARFERLHSNYQVVARDVIEMDAADRAIAHQAELDEMNS